ncbi:RNase AM [Aurantivibrio infirmus]
MNEHKVIDFHTHSSESDGILNPIALVSRAKACGVEVLALTDHDTVAGVAVAREQAHKEGIGFVTGIEFSSVWEGVNIHVIGLHIDIEHPALKNNIEIQGKARQERAQLIDQRLEKLGIKGALAGATSIAGGGIVARPHFAEFMLQQGHVTSIESAFKKYLGDGKAGDVKHLWPELTTIVKWIHEARGLAVLAHPNRYKMTNAKLRRLITAFKASGGDAMEVISGQQEQKVTSYLADLANFYELQASAGSDFHDPNSPWQSLGGFGKLPAHCRVVSY